MDLSKELGLTNYETRVYKTLVEIGRSGASKISEKSNVPPTAVYPSLKSLIAKNLIQKFEGDSGQFEAINPGVAIARFINSKKERLEETKERAIEELKRIKNRESIEDKRKVVEIGVGRSFSEEIYYGAFREAKKSIYILGWRFEKISDKYNVLQKLKEPLRKKVDIRLILIGDKNNKQKQLIKDYKKAGVKMKYLLLEDFSILITDSNNCKITIKKRGEEKTTLNILDDNLTRFIRQYYLDLWKRAEEI